MPKKLIILILTIALWGVGIYFLLRPLPIDLSLETSPEKKEELPIREVAFFQLEIPDIKGQTGWHVRGEKLVEEKEGIFYMTEVNGTIERIEQVPLYFYAPIGIYQIAKGHLDLYGPVHLYDGIYDIEMGAMEWDANKGEIFGKGQIVFKGPYLQINSEYATVKLANGIIDHISFSRFVDGSFRDLSMVGEELLCFFDEQGREEKLLFREGQVTMPIGK